MTYRSYSLLIDHPLNILKSSLCGLKCGFYAIVLSLRLLFA